MAINLDSSVKQFLSPEMISRIASAAGLDVESTTAAVDAAVPALLAGFRETVTEYGGARNLAAAVTLQAGARDRIIGMAPNEDASSIVHKGASVLTQLLGSRDQSALAGAVSNFASIPPAAGASLLAVLAPVVLDTIGRQFGPRGPDAAGLTQLLDSQKDHIVAALPAGFAKSLGASRILDSVGAARTTATSAATQAGNAALGAMSSAPRYAAYAAPRVGETADNPAPWKMPSWVYSLAAVAGIAGVTWFILGNRPDQAVQTAANQTIGSTVQTAAISTVDINRQLGSSLGTLKTSLESITDVASARAALPKLTEVTAQVDAATKAIVALPADQRKLIVGLDSGAMATVNQLFTKIMAIPGVSDVVKPAIDSLKTKLAAITA